MIWSNLDDIAGYFLSKESMSNKKLQKLVYYAYAWTLTALNDIENGLENRLFEERFEGWVHGPVCPKLYQMYKRNGWSDIPKNHNFDNNVFDKDVLEIINQVWEKYGFYTADELENMTHQEEPWKESRRNLGVFEPGNIELKDEIIFKYYIEMCN